MLHLIWSGPRPRGTIPWRNDCMCGYAHSILKGKMHRNGHSRSCLMLENVWLPTGALQGSPKVAWPWPLCSLCLLFARLWWSWGPSGQWCQPPIRSIKCYQWYVGFLWFPRLIFWGKYQWGVGFVPRHRNALALECMGNLRLFGHLMLVFFEELFDISWHWYVEGALMIFSKQLDPAVQIARPIFGKLIFFLDAFY